jgi:putative tryptophan/tyrosine transport system substrate-binding protein
MTGTANTPTYAGRIDARCIIFLISIVPMAAQLACCSKAVTPAARKVMFVNFDNERARAVFARFESACAAINIQERHNVSLEFVGVDVTDPIALHAALKRVLDANPVAIIAPTSPVLTQAVRMTETTPIVFFTHQDPVDLRLAPSLVNRPRNIAGISFYLGIEAKMLELLREAVPNARRIGYIFDSDEAPRPSVAAFLDSSARRHGVQWKLVPVQSIATFESDVRAAGAIDAWFVTKAGVLDEHREKFVAILAATRRPAIYPSRLDVDSGAPMAYEAVFDDPNGALARQLERVLSGVTPGEIPIERPKRFLLSLDVNAARAAGMQLSPRLLSRADRVR